MVTTSDAFTDVQRENRTSDHSPLLARLPVSLSLISLLAAAYFAPSDPGFLALVALTLASGTLAVAQSRLAHHIRVAASLFLLAFSIRIAATLAFHHFGIRGGDPMFGSLDAWGYDHWARWIADRWREGQWPSITGYDRAARWDVGFHYVLALFYLIFGETFLVGRAVVAMFGALAVPLFFLACNRLTETRFALRAAVVYALFPDSIGWSAYSILRDPFVWFLLFAALLLTLKLVERRSIRSGILLFFVLVALRGVRPYAEFLVVAAIALGGGVAWLREGVRTVLPRAAAFAGIILSVELLFFVIGFPSPLRMVEAYRLRSVLMKPIPVEQPSRPPAEVWRQESPDGNLAPGGPQPAPTPVAGAPAGMAADATGPPGPAPFGGSSFLGNVIRFTLGPFAWTALLGGADAWQAWGMWAWYLILPAAGIGFLSATRMKWSLRVVLITAVFVYLALIMGGRGDGFRQREMIVPFFLLAASVGLEAFSRMRKVFILVYAIYVCVLCLGIGFHIKTLKNRGLWGPPGNSAVRTFVGPPLPFSLREADAPAPGSRC